MRKRKLPSIRAMEEEANALSAPIAYNPGTMTDPLPAVERAMAAFRRRVRGNPVTAYQKCRLVLAELRGLAAEVFGGPAEGWAVADGHTATIDRVAASLAQHLEPGARVVSTHSEHVGGVGAFTADPRFRVTQVDVDRMVDTPGEIYFLSHLTYDTNLDNQGIIRALVDRPDRPLVVVDGCQAIGQIQVDVGALGCHAYLASAHKWLGGPHGTGLLYLSEEALARWPSPFRAGEPICPDLPIGRWEPRGGQDFARIVGLAAAIRAFQCHASPECEARERFAGGARALLGDRIEINPTSHQSGRVVAFGLRGMDVYPVYRRMLERGVAVKCIKKSVPGREERLEVVRVGFPWWADEAHVDRALGILAETVAELGGERESSGSRQPTAA